MKFIVNINKERCKNCKLCMNVCPVGIFQLSKNFNKSGYHYVELSDRKECIGCKKCVIICPDVVIEIYKK